MGFFKSHQSGKAYKKKLAALQKLSLDEQQKVTDETVAEDKRLAKKEALIQRLRDVFGEIIEQTVSNLQKKQRTKTTRKWRRRRMKISTSRSTTLLTFLS